MIHSLVLQGPGHECTLPKYLFAFRETNATRDFGSPSSNMCICSLVRALHECVDVWGAVCVKIHYWQAFRKVWGFTKVL